MNRFKKQAFLKEFPWLGNMLEQMEWSIDEVQEIKVKRADENLLSTVPSYYYWDGSAGVTHFEEKINFILKDGTIIKNAVTQEIESGSNYAYSQPQKRPGESLAEAIDRLNVASDLNFIVVCTIDIDDWPGREYSNYRGIVIYKPPKNRSYDDIIKHFKEQAERQVKREMDF